MHRRITAFMTELRRRHVFRAVAVYAAIAFVVLQAGEIILPAFEAPVWVLQLLVVLAALGFPLVLVVAWVYALTPRGLERTDLLDAEAGLESAPSVLPQVALALASLMVVGGAGLWFIRQPSVAGAEADRPVPAAFVSDPSEPITALAVLPLDDFSDDSTNAYFAASMHEEIISQLSRISALRVVSRTSASRYGNTTLSTPEIAAALGVQAIVEGSVTRSGDRVRITVQLIHAASDAHMWSNSYDREMSDVLTLQAEVAAEVARAIQGEVATAAPATLVATAPVNPEAHDAFMKGRFAQEEGTPEALRAAEGHYAEAVRIDSTFAPAVAGLAGTRFLIGMHEASDPRSRLSQARVGAQRALELDGESEEARAVLVAVDEQLAALGEQLQISMEASGTMDSLDVDYLRRFTDFGKAVQQIYVTSAPEGAPRASSWQWNLGAAQRLIADGQYDIAAEVLTELVSENPVALAGWDALERAYVMQGDLPSAVETRKARVRNTASDAAQAEADLGTLDSAIADNGSEGYWTWLRDDHRTRRERGDYASDVEYAAACVALGEHEDALIALESGLESRDRGLLTLRSDPIWDPLRQDPRFKAIQAQLRRRPPRGARGARPPTGP